jgi:hypothetical protein
MFVAAVWSVRPQQTALISAPGFGAHFGSRADPHFAADTDTLSAYWASLGR